MRKSNETSIKKGLGRPLKFGKKPWLLQIRIDPKIRPLIDISTDRMARGSYNRWIEVAIIKQLKMEGLIK
jgi:hypothetical protein